MRKVVDFLKETKEELVKITYPDKEAVKNATKSIVIIVFSTAIYMEIIDLLIKAIYKFVLKINL